MAENEIILKSAGLKWIVIISAAILLLAIVLPLIFQLSMRIDMRATIESSNQWEEGYVGVLAGSDYEIYRKVVSTEYTGHMVPSKLEVNRSRYMTIQALYGPLMITGTQLALDAAPDLEASDLKSSAGIGFKSFVPTLIFFLVLLLLMLWFDLVLKNSGEALKFLVVLSLFWLVWSFIVWAVSNWMIGPVGDTLNLLLTEEQGSAKFTLGILNIFHAAIRIFLIGAIYWAISFTLRRARTEPDEKVSEKVRG